MQVSPALPWNGDTGGTIELAQPVTFDELKAGILQFTLTLNDTPFVAVLSEGSNDLIIGHDTQQTFNTVYKIQRFSGSLSTLQVTKNSGSQAEGYALSDVKRATGPLAEVYADQACTTRPVVGQSYSSLFVKLNKAINLGDSMVFGEEQDQFENLVIATPTELIPDDPYNIRVYVDFSSAEFSESMIGVIECQTLEEPVTIGSPLKTDFGYIYD